MTTRQDIQKPAPGAIIELFELDATMLGAPSVYRFVNWANPLGGDVVWRGQTYTRYPVEAEGFELSGRGALPRPKLRVANATGLMGALAIELDDLLGARVTRWRTFVHYLDAVNFPPGPVPVPGALVCSRNSVASYFDASGTMQTVPANTPRVDYDPATGECRGLLVELGSTNYVLNSSAPSSQSIAVTAQQYTLSFYGTGSITLSGAYSGTIPSAGAWPARATLTFTPAAGTLTMSVSGDVRYCQLEAGPIATSWIPTGGGAVVRASDYVYISNASWGAQLPYAGGLAADFTVPFNTSGYNRSLVLRKQATGFTDAWVYILANNNTTGPRSVQWEGCGSAFNAATGMLPGQQVRIAGTLVNTGRAACVNGGTVFVRGSAGTYPANPPDLLEIASGNGAIAHRQWTRSLQVYDRVLSAAELQAITSGGSVPDLPVIALDTSSGVPVVYKVGPSNPTADPNQYLSRDVWVVDRKSSENRVVIEFELAAPIDVAGVMLPRRQVVANVCAWRYRSAECGYAGGPVADRDDNPTTNPALDACGKRLASCKLRFGQTGVLPFGGFPGTRRIG